MKGKNNEPMNLEVDFDPKSETESGLAELWSRLLQAPSVESEDYNDWLDGLSPADIRELANDPETLRWMAVWDEPRFRRFFPDVEVPGAASQA